MLLSTLREGKADVSEPAYTVEAQLGFEPRDISIVADGYAVLSGTKSGSVLHLLDALGKERWRTKIPFEVKQPPVDGNGRIVLAGKGFAAVRDGKLLFAHPSEHEQWATAFEEGTVALSTGGELRIVNPDGTIRQSFRVQEGERLTTPPAIAPDGTIWVASDKALYHLE